MSVRVGEIDNADKESTVSTLSVLTAGSSYVTWSGPLRFFRAAIESCASQSLWTTTRIDGDASYMLHGAHMIRARRHFS